MEGRFAGATILSKLRLPVVASSGCRIGPVFVQKQIRTLTTARLPGGSI
jgi:hypothetical protein